MASFAPKGHIRKLWPADKAAFRDHLLRLDFDIRRKRFAMAATDEFIDRYAATCFNLESIIHGYFVDGTLRGVGELRLLDPANTLGEAAFSVEADFQGVGVGTDLMQHVLLTARNRGVKKVYMNCLASNRSMQKMARAAGAELEFEAGEVVGLVLPPHASPTSLVREVVLDSEGWATAVFDMQRRFLSGQWLAQWLRPRAG
jgi:GNAT superfamily N-acetyltransferase